MYHLFHWDISNKGSNHRRSNHFGAAAAGRALTLGGSRLKLLHEQFCSDLRSLVCYALTMAIVMEAAYSFIAPAGPSIIVLAATAVLLFHRR